MRRIREAALQAVEPTLSARQRQLLAQMREGGGTARREVRRQAVVWVLRNNKPEPVPVVIGVADNANTVLVSGLEEGDLVITGGGPRDEEAEQQRNRGPLGGAGGPRIRGT